MTDAPTPEEVIAREVATTRSPKTGALLVGRGARKRAGTILSALTAAGYVIEQGWQPIATAPRDGSYLVKNRLGEVCPCQSREGQRIVSNMPGYADWMWGESATHWRPLPAAIRALPDGEVGG